MSDNESEPGHGTLWRANHSSNTFSNGPSAADRVLGDDPGSDDDFFLPDEQNGPESPSAPSTPSPSQCAPNGDEDMPSGAASGGMLSQSLPGNAATRSSANDVQIGAANERPAIDDVMQFASAIGRRVRLKTEHQEELAKIAAVRFNLNPYFSKC